LLLCFQNDTFMHTLAEAGRLARAFHTFAYALVNAKRLTYPHKEDSIVSDLLALWQQWLEQRGLNDPFGCTVSFAITFLPDGDLRLGISVSPPAEVLAEEEGSLTLRKAQWDRLQQARDDTRKRIEAALCP
jgi:hypothetical protein